MIVIVFGVSGSGKTTIGARLAQELDCTFLEGDDLHPAENVARMSSGTPLTDEDRRPWLAAIHARVLELVRNGEDVVVACSALKRDYRRMLATGLPITWLYLRVTEAIARERVAARAAHFMKARMVESQFEALQEPTDAIVIDASMTPDAIVQQALPLLRNSVDLRVSSSAGEMSLAVARAAAGRITEAVAARGRAAVALSGGDTPRELHELLATTFREQVPWEHVHVFWGDERHVPHDHPASNFRMAHETLLAHVPCRPEHIHPVPTQLPTPEAAADDYERTLRQFFGAAGPIFDLNLLGIGPDGHTASIFPGSAAVTDSHRWVVGVHAPAVTPAGRVTLTLPALTASAHLDVMVAGARKAAALRHALTATTDPASYPAAGLRRTSGKLTWWVDRDATADLALRAGHP